MFDSKLVRVYGFMPNRSDIHHNQGRMFAVSAIWKGMVTLFIKSHMCMSAGAHNFLLSLGMHNRKGMAYCYLAAQ